MICAFVVGTLTAVLLFALCAICRVPALTEVPLCLFWLTIFAFAFRHRSILRRQSAWLLVGALACECFFVAFHDFDLLGSYRRDALYHVLSSAVRTNDVAAIIRLLPKDRDLDYVPRTSPLSHSDQASYYENEERPIDIAIDADNIRIAHLLADHGAMVGPRGEAGLEAAAARGDLDMLRFLLEHGVAPNLPSGDSVALRYAIDAGRPEIVSALLDAGANPNSQLIARRKRANFLGASTGATGESSRHRTSPATGRSDRLTPPHQQDPSREP